MWRFWMSRATWKAWAREVSVLFAPAVWWTTM
jgi:hypothetical protein